MSAVIVSVLDTRLGKPVVCEVAELAGIKILMGPGSVGWMVMTKFGVQPPPVSPITVPLVILTCAGARPDTSSLNATLTTNGEV